MSMLLTLIRTPLFGSIPCSIIHNHMSSGIAKQYGYVDPGTLQRINEISGFYTNELISRYVLAYCGETLEKVLAQENQEEIEAQQGYLADLGISELEVVPIYGFSHPLNLDDFPIHNTRWEYALREWILLVHRVLAYPRTVVQQGHCVFVSDNPTSRPELLINVAEFACNLAMPTQTVRDFAMAVITDFELNRRVVTRNEALDLFSRWYPGIKLEALPPAVGESVCNVIIQIQDFVEAVVLSELRQKLEKSYRAG